MATINLSVQHDMSYDFGFGGGVASHFGIKGIVSIYLNDLQSRCFSPRYFDFLPHSAYYDGERNVLCSTQKLKTQKRASAHSISMKQNIDNVGGACYGVA